DPANPEVLIALGNYHDFLDHTGQAEEIYQRVAREFPNHVGALNYLCNIQRKQGRWSEALATVQRARALDPLSYSVWQTLRGFLTDARRFEEADRLWTELGH